MLQTSTRQVETYKINVDTQGMIEITVKVPSMVHSSDILSHLHSKLKPYKESKLIYHCYSFISINRWNLQIRVHWNCSQLLHYLSPLYLTLPTLIRLFNPAPYSFSSSANGIHIWNSSLDIFVEHLEVVIFTRSPHFQDSSFIISNI